MLTWLAVLIGGALGSGARHGVNVIAPRLFGGAAPYATAAVNMIGALAIGVLAGMLQAQRLSLTTTERALYLTGILGGFTTFSSFMLDSLVLWQAGSTAKAALNLAGQLIVGTMLAYAGYRAGLR
ncbi:MAG: fluoride efflux transporter FluC [Vicinamibacterales bacterium]